MTQFIIAVAIIVLIQLAIARSKIRSAIYFTTGCIGAPTHEFAHYLACKLVGFPVVQVKLFQMPTPTDARLGYVEFVPTRGFGSGVKSILVAIAPLPFGILLLYAASQVTEYSLLIDVLYQANSVTEYYYAINLWMSQVDTLFLLGLYMLASITLYMLPSVADIQIAVRGVFDFVIIGAIIITVFSISYSQIFLNLNHLLLFSSQFMFLGAVLSLPILLIALITKN
ncbi:hypothetical protein L0B53_19200 (plasmid) [Vibrio sp. SS-MA-C1-2]|uniref:hypothetical protein n=1 Tax=Vibrio sp. SS-MA-C1-2 TaxID=2908646 RepID=UPI001F48DEB3|nr:hypothetical protein [Vibrio sp. SS-MA-C1-2]UJF20262.1 hypothetical protein L0B53_19200 [Vibrio sp. SS-MA-C1-2]